MQKKLIRIISIVLILSPWVYVPTIYKEIFLVVIGIVLLAITIDIKKKIKIEI